MVFKPAQQRLICNYETSWVIFRRKEHRVVSAGKNNGQIDLLRKDTFYGILAKASNRAYNGMLNNLKSKNIY